MNLRFIGIKFPYAKKIQGGFKFFAKILPSSFDVFLFRKFVVEPGKEQSEDAGIDKSPESADQGPDNGRVIANVE